MHVLITGAAGMLGRKLTKRLVDVGTLRANPIRRIDLIDIVETPIEDSICFAHIADLCEPGVAAELLRPVPDVVFHLAGVVSGEAEANFDKGMAVNIDGTRALFNALRFAEGTPRVVFTSSIAVFGAPFPDPIPDDFHLTPLTSYGTQKMVAEALLADYSRRGFLDGIGVRLPTISVRPGSPNAAASGFFSSIIREPLAGVQAVLPVSRDVRHSHASPRTAIRYLLHAAELDSAVLGARRNLTMPGVSVTVGEQIEALARVAGADAAGLIVESPAPDIADIVAGWPERFDAQRALRLGFIPDRSYDDIIRAYLEDDFVAD
ncbi:MAG: SDR family oxidoreductase [Acidimicrobiales bacterium]|nr:SDR family oxidoreductase [Acidimicrobiales bacterium]MYA24791.1 SDR family oxidoreductase [Acidimicrobiales bacterium]MYD83241.1 SDR family oxidoreductase [Acidimicrobiales bacterium]MYG61703.1 SDR family oxidoreductase [Acidimicrobiales bacterium]MYJ66307.1 SDR family oxidoreductase [Acidimicrobiales bacterium]